jgi:hydrogenase nickel incorporation protein HypA/HybF
MHELSVTESILKIVLEYGKTAQARRITNIYLVLGNYSSIIDDSIQFYWGIIAENTIAQNAKLNFSRIEPEFICLACQNKYNPEKELIACPHCGSSQVKLITGDEFYIEAIDIDK